VEDTANGPAILGVLKKEIPGMLAIKPEGGKQARAAAVAPLIEAGNVYLPMADEHRGLKTRCWNSPASLLPRTTTASTPRARRSTGCKPSAATGISARE
jgi:hypothetical protein